jgi:hypothetical protein
VSNISVLMTALSGFSPKLYRYLIILPINGEVVYVPTITISMNLKCIGSADQDHLIRWVPYGTACLSGGLSCIVPYFKKKKVACFARGKASIMFSISGLSVSVLECWIIPETTLEYCPWAGASHWASNVGALSKRRERTRPVVYFLWVIDWFI